MEKLIARVLPYKAAKIEECFEGVVALKDLPRVLPMLFQVKDEQLWVRLGFHLDDQNRVVAVMTLEGQLPLQCQRCLRPIAHPIHQTTELMVVKTEAEAKLVPPQYEVLVVSDELNTREAVEDEVIVSIPIMPVHHGEEKDCASPENQAYCSPQKETYKPFLVLKELKKLVKE